MGTKFRHPDKRSRSAGAFRRLARNRGGAGALAFDRMGFQLIAVFNQRFQSLNDGHQILHLVAFLRVTLAMGLIMAPAAYHRPCRKWPGHAALRRSRLGAALSRPAAFHDRRGVRHLPDRLSRDRRGRRGRGMCRLGPAGAGCPVVRGALPGPDVTAVERARTRRRSRALTFELDPAIERGKVPRLRRLPRKRLTRDDGDGVIPSAASDLYTLVASSKARGRSEQQEMHVACGAYEADACTG